MARTGLLWILGCMAQTGLLWILGCATQPASPTPHPQSGQHVRSIVAHCDTEVCKHMTKIERLTAMHACRAACAHRCTNPRSRMVSEMDYAVTATPPICMVCMLRCLRMPVRRSEQTWTYSPC